jgi:hypothetical protein
MAISCTVLLGLACCCCVGIICSDKHSSGRSPSLTFVGRKGSSKNEDALEDRSARRRGSFTPAYDKNLHLDMPVANPVP